MNENILKSKIGEMTNNGVPATTALVMAYELMQVQLQNSNQLESIEQDAVLEIAKNLGNLAGTILNQMKAAGGVGREEPDDEVPGCNTPQAPGGGPRCRNDPR